MSDRHPIDDVESLRSALTALLEEADRNDVAVEGALTIRTSASQHPDREVQIWQIE